MGEESRLNQGDTIVYTVGHGADTITGFSKYDKINITNLAISASNIGTDAEDNTVITVNSGKTKGSINLGDYDRDITIIDKSGTSKTYTQGDGGTYVDSSTVSSSDLLRDDNYATMTPQLSSIVNSAADTSLGDLSLDNAASLMQKASLISYSGDKK